MMHVAAAYDIMSDESRCFCSLPLFVQSNGPGYTGVYMLWTV